MVKKKTEMSKEVDEMLDDFFPEEPPAEPPVEPPVEPPIEPPVEEPPAEPPVVEPPVEEPLVVEPLLEEPPAEPPIEEPVVEPIVEEETSEQELERLRNQNKLLIDRVEDMAGGVAPSAPPAPEPPAESPPVIPPVVPVVPVVPPVVASPVEPEVIDFIKGRTLEALVDDPNGLNMLLNEVFQMGAKQIGVAPAPDVEPVVERILNALPSIVQAQVTQQTAIKVLVDDFYDNNKDLVGVRRTVAAHANEVHSEHPDWDTAKVFSEAGIKTRAVLGMRIKALTPSTPTTPVTRPAFARTRGARRGGEEKPVGLQKEVDDLIPNT